jgi:hypothetical protein
MVLFLVAARRGGRWVQAELSEQIVLLRQDVDTGTGQAPASSTTGPGAAEQTRDVCPGRWTLPGLTQPPYRDDQR